MTDNQDRQFSPDQGIDRDRQQQQQQDGRPTPQGQQQDSMGQGQGQQQQSQYGQQGQQDPQGQYGQRDQQQDQYRGQDEHQQGAGSGTSASGITGQRDDSSGISGGAPAGQGGGAEQYGMETERARNQQQQQAGADQKIDEDRTDTNGRSGAGGYGN